MLTKRQEKILENIINEYTISKKPIGSKEFCQKYFKDLSSATIRREFKFLTANKYLIQPYLSAGRLPTDKAYQWFVKEILLNPERKEEQERRWKEKLADWENLSFEEIAKKISQICESLTIGYLLNNQLIYRYGLKKLFEQLEKMEFNNWQSVWDDIDMLDERLKERIDVLTEEPFQIFIGRESPITRDKNLSVISYTVFNDENEENLLVLVGPKNIICEKNLNILQNVYNLLNGSNLNDKK